MFSVQYEITEADIDNEYRHFHHTGSIKMFERARCDYLDFLGYPLQSLIDGGYLLVVAAISVRYLRELKVGPITVTCENPRVSVNIMSIDQKILNARGKIAVQATVEMACMSSKSRRTTPAPAAFIQKFIEYQTAGSEPLAARQGD